MASNTPRSFTNVVEKIRYRYANTKGSAIVMVSMATNVRLPFRNPACNMTRAVGMTPGPGTSHNVGLASMLFNHHVPRFLPYQEVVAPTHLNTSTRPVATTADVVWFVTVYAVLGGEVVVRRTTVQLEGRVRRLSAK